MCTIFPDSTILHYKRNKCDVVGYANSIIHFFKANDSFKTKNLKTPQETVYNATSTLTVKSTVNTTQPTPTCWLARYMREPTESPTLWNQWNRP